MLWPPLQCMHHMVAAVGLSEGKCMNQSPCSGHHLMPLQSQGLVSVRPTRLTPGI